MFSRYHKKIIRLLVATIIGFGLVGLAASFANAATADPRLPSDLENYIMVGTQSFACNSGREFVATRYLDPAKSTKLKYIVLFERVGASIEVRVVIEAVRFVVDMDSDDGLTYENGVNIKVYLQQSNHPVETFDNPKKFDKKYPTVCDLPQALAIERAAKQSTMREF